MEEQIAISVLVSFFPIDQFEHKLFEEKGEEYFLVAHLLLQRMIQRFSDLMKPLSSCGLVVFIDRSKPFLSSLQPPALRARN